MKTHILTTLATLLLIGTSLADSPDAILKDYRKQATQATQRLNETLEKQSTKIAAELLRKSDTAGAEAVNTQVKAKLAGEPVAMPHVAVAALFAQYDGARATALQPVQKASAARLDSLLKVAGGPKADDIESLTKAKAEIDAGKVGKTASFPLLWTYHRTVQSPVMAELKLETDGTWKLTDPKTKVDSESGTWVQTSRTTLDLDWKGVVWKMSFDKKEGVIDRPDIGKRYLALKDK